MNTLTNTTKTSNIKTEWRIVFLFISNSQLIFCGASLFNNTSQPQSTSHKNIHIHMQTDSNPWTKANNVGNHYHIHLCISTLHNFNSIIIPKLASWGMRTGKRDTTKTEKDESITKFTFSIYHAMYMIAYALKLKKST